MPEDIGPSPSWRDGERKPLPGPMVVRFHFEGHLRVDLWTDEPDEAIADMKDAIKAAITDAVEKYDLFHGVYNAETETVDYDVLVSYT